jgi:hypothetical protein
VPIAATDPVNLIVTGAEMVRSHAVSRAVLATGLANGIGRAIQIAAAALSHAGTQLTTVRVELVARLAVQLTDQRGTVRTRSIAAQRHARTAGHAGVEIGHPILATHPVLDRRAGAIRDDALTHAVIATGLTTGRASRGELTDFSRSTVELAGARPGTDTLRHDLHACAGSVTGRKIVLPILTANRRPRLQAATGGKHTCTLDATFAGCTVGIASTGCRRGGILSTRNDDAREEQKEDSKSGREHAQDSNVSNTNSRDQAERPMDKKLGEQAKCPMDKKLGEQAKRPMDKKSLIQRPRPTRAEWILVSVHEASSKHRCCNCNALFRSSEAGEERTAE